jgi:WD40 repeat protein
MEIREKVPTKQIVRVPSQALAVRSAALVTRGLRDLARDSNWLIKKVFSGQSSQLVISSAGELCALSPLVRQGTERIALYDIERGVPTLALVVPGEPDVCPPGLPAAFAWSPTARHLIASWGGWLPELHVFDLQGKVFLGGFGDFKSFPSCLAWSDTGKYFAAASRGGREARLRLWPAAQQSPSAMPFTAESAAELCAPGAGDNWFESQSVDAESGDEGSFSGFGRTAFSPDETTLASVVEIEGEWADDSIVLLDAPTLRKQCIIPAQGRITDIAWTPDSRQLIYCSAGQAYRVPAQSAERFGSLGGRSFSSDITSASPSGVLTPEVSALTSPAICGAEPQVLPFGAELVACHPHLPLCLCFSSWLKNSAKGRLFLVELNRLAVFDEYAAEGVVNLRWSLDGSKAYAVTADGLAYIYEPPLL